MDLNSMAHELLDELQGREKLKGAMMQAGYTENDYKTFNTLNCHFMALLKAGGAAAGVAEHTDHLASAEYMKANAVYTKKVVRFMFEVFERTGIDPNEFGYKGSCEELVSYMDEAIASADKIIAKHELAANLSVH